MERGITGKLLKKWLQLIEKKQHLFVWVGVCVCVSISRNIYEVIFCRQNQKYIDSSDDDDDEKITVQAETFFCLKKELYCFRVWFITRQKDTKKREKESPHYHLCQCFLRLHLQLHRPHHLPPQLLWQASHFLDLVLEDIIQNLLYSGKS